LETEKKNILEDVFSSVLSLLKIYHPPENLKFIYLGILQSLKLRISIRKILSMSLKSLISLQILGVVITV